MSFGVGVTDIIQALHYVKITCDSWKEAPERYQIITRRVRALRGPLKRLARHYGTSQRHISRSAQRDLDNLLYSIENTLASLEHILAKRSDLRFWDRLRLNTHEINDLSTILDRHIQDLTCLCSSLSLENDREIQNEQKMLRHGQRDLRQGQDELLRLVSRLLPSRVHAKNLQTPLDSVESTAVSPARSAHHLVEHDWPRAALEDPPPPYPGCFPRHIEREPNCSLIPQLTPSTGSERYARRTAHDGLERRRGRSRSPSRGWELHTEIMFFHRAHAWEYRC